jgi:hypothetical protein
MGDLVLILLVTSGTFFIKAITGFGGPLLAIPLLAPVIGVEHAVVGLSLANLSSNILLLIENRSGARAMRPFLVRVLGAGAIAVVAGTLVLVNVDDRILLAVLAASVFAYVALALANPNLRLGNAAGLRAAVPIGIVGGFVHGATGNSAAVFGTFFHSLALPRQDFVAAVTTVFLVLSTLQVGTLASLGSFTTGRLAQAAAAVVPVLIVTPLGTRVAARLDAKTFGRIVLAMLTVAGVRLVFGVFGI